MNEKKLTSFQARKDEFFYLFDLKDAQTAKSHKNPLKSISVKKKKFWNQLPQILNYITLYFVTMATFYMLIISNVYVC